MSVGLALATAACFPGSARDDATGVAVPRSMSAADAERPPECNTEKLRYPCDDVISRARPLDYAGLAQRAVRPVLALGADGRLRYTDTARIAHKETAKSVRDGLEVDFAAEQWVKMPAGDAESLRFRLARTYGTLELTLTVRQIGSAIPADKAIVEVVATIQTVDAVT